MDVFYFLLFEPFPEIFETHTVVDSKVAHSGSSQFSKKGSAPKCPT